MMSKFYLIVVILFTLQELVLTFDATSGLLKTMQVLKKSLQIDVKQSLLYYTAMAGMDFFVPSVLDIYLSLRYADITHFASHNVSYTHRSNKLSLYIYAFLYACRKRF